MHEAHPATTMTAKHPLPRVEGGNGRESWEGLDLKGGYKKVINKGKGVRLFEIRASENNFLLRDHKRAIILLAVLSRKARPTFLT